MKQKKGIVAAGAIIAAAAMWGAWLNLCSPTKVAFVNYQAINLGQIARANGNSFVRISELDVAELDKASSFDMVLVNGMGLRITAEQRAELEKAAADGTPVLTTMATNPANNIVSVDSIQASTLKAYLEGGGRKNYANMLEYIRKDIDGKWFRTTEPEETVPAANEMLYHAAMTGDGQDDRGFNSIAGYEAFLRENGLYSEEAPRIIVTGQMGEPADLIRRLEETGSMVYPVRSMRRLVEGHHIDSIRPSAVINMAHGRMGDYMTDYLTRQNIPLFSPLNVNRLTEEWEADPMGMNGGFMSQSIVTPEIDGAIRPFALFAQRTDENGLRQVYAVPERLETFVSTVNNYISLQRKANKDKRIAIVYYKGPGQNALTASGMEVVPSLYNMLVFLRDRGYDTGTLPSSPAELAEIIQRQGAVFGSYTEGAASGFMRTGNPLLIHRSEYESWVKASLRPEKYAEVTEANGNFPGPYMAADDSTLAVARIRFGNIVLLPQPAAGGGENNFNMVHGTNAAPPHNYIAAYLWIQHGFKADALIHFGTHGSLEFTPQKQVALCGRDWPDRLVGALPHLYVYSIGNVGEGIIAKRRSYAGLQSYLTAPFMESCIRSDYRGLTEAIKAYYNTDDNTRSKAAEKVKLATVKLGIHRDLGLDSLPQTQYSEEDIVRIENFAEELANEKITGQLYVMGKPYDNDRITSTVYAMATDPIAYSLYSLDRQRGKADAAVAGKDGMHGSAFTRRYLEPAKALVGRLLASPESNTDRTVCEVAGITMQQLEKARTVADDLAPKDLMSMMMSMGESRPASAAPDSSHGKAMKDMAAKSDGKMDKKQALAMAKAMGASPEALRKMEAAMSGKPQADGKGKPSGMTDMMAMAGNMMKGRKQYTEEEKAFATAVAELDRTIKNVYRYREALLTSPRKELESIANALEGGFVQPSPGGDPVANPNTLPTGRNLYAINAEATPSEQAWEKGKTLAENTIEMYRRRHNDSLPRKVSYTLWSSEFIETEGATVAQVLYMLGVEPVRDTFGRVTDLRLIPSEELGRPRIDVVVQTSGQLRDIAASRLFLINRAADMAANSADDKYPNFVAEGRKAVEKALTGRGITPKEAREIATYKVFGGVNGNYGTGIQGMVQAGDRWTSEKEIADTYINNMGAFYGDEQKWQTFVQYAFEAALTNTDAVVQPRQSNTWGALSLDHVYEFMGGMNLAVRNVTGKDPDAYLSDYRNRNRVRMQEVKEAIGVESRTTIFNPNYIKEKMKGDAGDAGTFAEIVQNTYGWNVMKPQAIDNEMWNEIYSVYVKDKFGLGVEQFFESKNPAALQEMTAVMMETARKGMWKASPQQLADVARLHTALVEKYAPSCSGTVCDNTSLREFIASQVDSRTAEKYSASIRQIRQAAASAPDDKSVVMKKEQLGTPAEEEKADILGKGIAALMAVAVTVLVVVLVKKRSRQNRQ